MSRSHLVDLVVEKIAETEAAILVSEGEAEGCPKIWLPKSQVEIEPVRGSRNLVTVTLPEWLAEERGLV